MIAATALDVYGIEVMTVLEKVIVTADVADHCGSVSRCHPTAQYVAVGIHQIHVIATVASHV